MNISKVKVLKVENGGKCLAVASFLINDCFAVHGVRIIDGKEGLFIAMPNRRNEEGVYKDICHPINQEARDIIQNAIIEEYNKLD